MYNLLTTGVAYPRVPASACPATPFVISMERSIKRAIWSAIHAQFIPRGLLRRVGRSGDPHSPRHVKIVSLGENKWEGKVRAPRSTCSRDKKKGSARGSALHSRATIFGSKVGAMGWRDGTARRMWDCIWALHWVARRQGRRHGFKERERSHSPFPCQRCTSNEWRL